MSKYIYPAIFTKEKNGYSVNFPDVDGCFTCGATLAEAIEMASDALSLMIADYEETGTEIPTATTISHLVLNNNEFAKLITGETSIYKR